MQAILDCQKPVIVALNGTAAGGGSMLVLAADLVIAADTAQIIQVFVRRGARSPTAASRTSSRASSACTRRRSSSSSATTCSAADAERIGIVNKVVPAAELHAATKEWAERLASGPTKAIGWSKQLLHDASRARRAATSSRTRRCSSS